MHRNACLEMPCPIFYYVSQVIHILDPISQGIGVELGLWVQYG